MLDYMTNNGNMQIGDHNKIVDKRGREDDWYWKILEEALKQQKNSGNFNEEFLSKMENCTSKRKKEKLKRLVEKWGNPVFTNFLANICTESALKILEWL